MRTLWAQEKLEGQVSEAGGQLNQGLCLCQDFTGEEEGGIEYDLPGPCSPIPLRIHKTTTVFY